MVQSIFSTVAVAALALLPALTYAQSSPKCGAGSKCPTNLPCCSQYGECGVGAFCLGGCDPLFSNSFDSCTPEPVCQNKDLKMTSLDGIQSKKDYLGDSSKADWVADGDALAFQNTVLLTLSPEDAGLPSSSGTVLASTVYVWYGKITASLKTSRGAGVVTAFIMLSDVKDEIDFEFIGTDLLTAQTNYYSQGVTNYMNTGNVTVKSDTFANFHTYEIDWQPDQITWAVDGTILRTKKRSETWNATSNRFDYPQTPSRVQLSVWPGGKSTNPEGTIQWAGGPIDYNSPDIKAHGYDFAMIQSVKIQCYDPPTGAKQNGKTSYLYNDAKGTNDTVEITDKSTVLKSLLGTGTNMSADYPSGPAQSQSSVAVIPGLSGAGPGANGLRGESGGGGGSGPAATGSGGSGGSGGAAGASPTAKATQTSFSQGAGASGGTKGNSAPPKSEKVLQGSMFAGLIVLIGLCLL